jgi:hypothetical protein
MENGVLYTVVATFAVAFGAPRGRRDYGQLQGWAGIGFTELMP